MKSKNGTVNIKLELHPEILKFVSYTIQYNDLNIVSEL